MEKKRHVIENVLKFCSDEDVEELGKFDKKLAIVDRVRNSIVFNVYFKRFFRFLKLLRILLFRKLLFS